MLDTDFSSDLDVWIAQKHGEQTRREEESKKISRWPLRRRVAVISEQMSPGAILSSSGRCQHGPMTTVQYVTRRVSDRQTDREREREKSEFRKITGQQLYTTGRVTGRQVFSFFRRLVYNNALSGDAETLGD